MPTPSDQDVAVRWALRQARLRNQQWRRLGDGATEDGLIVPRAMPSPEHYHLVYNVPKDELSIPHFADVYITAREAYQKIYDMGNRAKFAEFYDDGTIGLETRLHGRADLWWIIVEVAACIKANCLKNVERQKLKRQLILVPEQD
jgi:hypothetical protein